MQKLITLILVCLIPMGVSAQENTTTAETEDPLACPVEIPEYTEKTCQDTAYFKNIIGPEFFPALRKEFNTHLQTILLDNQIYPPNIVPYLSTDLRIYNNCLQDICKSVYTCGEFGISNKIPLKEYNWCTEKSIKLFQLHKTKLEYMAVNNTYRKARSLFEEKINRVGYLFSLYIHQGMKANLILLHKTRNKINKLIPNPQ